MDAPCRWVGREYDPETGFYFMRARYYDPAVGRFTQEDPLGTAGGTNLYAYVDGQPLEARDPSGMLKDYIAFSNEGAMASLDFMRGIRASWEWSFASYGHLASMELLYRLRGILKRFDDITHVEVGCRPLYGAAGNYGNHCAVRFSASDGSRKAVGELLDSFGENDITVWDGKDGSHADDYDWHMIATPKGMTDHQFAIAVVDAFVNLGGQLTGHRYDVSGAVNSNHFVWAVITIAGGSVPWSVVPKDGYTPGICGGFATSSWNYGESSYLAPLIDTGTSCSP